MLQRLDIEKYKSEGYCVVNDVVDTLFIDNFLRELKQIVSNVLKIDYSNESNDLDSMIDKLYCSNSKAAGFIYDVINMHNLLYSIFDISSIKSSLKELLKMKKDYSTLLFLIINFE